MRLVCDKISYHIFLIKLKKAIFATPNLRVNLELTYFKKEK